MQAIAPYKNTVVNYMLVGGVTGLIPKEGLGPVTQDADLIIFR